MLEQLYEGQCFQWVHSELQENIAINQYTGIKDIDGDEIYEGDILLLTCKSNPKCYWKYIVSSSSGIVGCNLYAMEFENNLRCNDEGFYTYEVTKRKYIRRNYISSEMEIVGNIYENKDWIDE